MGMGKALASGMGILPAIASGAMGEKNKGFALGILPGMLYKQNAKKEEAKDRETQERDAATRRAEIESKSREEAPAMMKKGGKVAKAKKYAGGGSVGSASKRADGCAVRGKTKGRMV